MQDVMKEMDGMNHLMTDNDGDKNMEPPKCPSSMNINDLYDSIKLSEELALENYQHRNGDRSSVG